MFGGLRNNHVCPIGVDWGAHSVKMLQLDRRDGATKVIGAASRTIPADMPKQGPERVKRMAELLGALHKDGGFEGRRVVSCLPATSVQYKNLRLPRMPETEIRAAVEWEASDRLRLSPEAMRLEYYDAGEVRQGEEVREEIILLAAPHAMIEEHLDSLLAAGLKPEAIDAVPGAIARCFAGASTDPECPASAFVDIGLSSTKVLISRGGRVVFFKLIEIGGGKLDETLAKHLSLTPADAAEIRRKRRNGGDAGDGVAADPARGQAVDRAIFEAIRSIAGDLAKELSLCMRYYSVSFRGRRPETIQLVGGESYDPNLAKVLAEELSIPCEPASPLRGIDVSRSAELAAVENAHSEWAVATGLSLRKPAGAARKGAA